MKTKSLWLAILLIAAVLLAACTKETESTVSGMVVMKEGTVIYLLESNSVNTTESLPTEDGEAGSEPSRPDMDFNPEDADGSRPSRSGKNFNPDNADRSGKNRPDRNFNIDELTKIDISEAHISIEIDEGKEAGTIDDVKEGSRVTIVLKGEKPVTVLVSANQRNGNWNRNNKTRSN